MTAQEQAQAEEKRLRFLAEYLALSQSEAQDDDAAGDINRIGEQAYAFIGRTLERGGEIVEQVEHSIVFQREMLTTALGKSTAGRWESNLRIYQEFLAAWQSEA